MFGAINKHSCISDAMYVSFGVGGWFLYSTTNPDLSTGPFLTSAEAEAAYESFKARPNPYGLGYCGENVQLHEPLFIGNPECVWIGAHSRIDSFVKLEGGLGLCIGQFVHIASFSHMGVGGGVTVLENETGFSSGSKVVSGTNEPHAVSHSIVAPAHKIVVTRSKTVIKESAILYANAVVLPNVTVGKHACVGAGAVVKSDTVIPDWEIWAGVPAKVVGHVNEGRIRVEIV